MSDPSEPHIFPIPTIIALGDSALVVRFGTVLSDGANRAAIALARVLDVAPVKGVVEVVPYLISVLVRFDPMTGDPAAIAGELRLRLFGLAPEADAGRLWDIAVVFDGPDIGAVAETLGLSVDAFIEAHNRMSLRVLATGFAPGFVYCGLHETALVLPRRAVVRPMVPAGSVLFAAGQTAIAATEMPTGWHVIGYIEFRNFDASSEPPTRLAAGDSVRFGVRA